MLLAVAALSVIQREGGLEGTEVVVSGAGLFTGAPLSSEDGGETFSTLLPAGQNEHNDNINNVKHDMMRLLLSHKMVCCDMIFHDDIT